MLSSGSGMFPEAPREPPHIHPIPVESAFRRLVNLVYYAALVYTIARFGYWALHGWLGLAALALALLALVVCLGAIAGVVIYAIWYGRVTGKGMWALVSPKLKEEFRFGHKPWHQVALVVAAVPFAYMALIFGAGAGEVGVAAAFGGAAAFFVFLAVLANRRHRPTR